MHGLDIIGADTLGFDWGSLASGILSTAGGAISSPSGGDAEAKKKAEEEKKKLEEAKKAAEAQAATYKKIAIGGGVALVVAALAGWLTFGKSKQR